MSAPLKEVRVYLPEWAHILLTARARAFGEDISSVAKREILLWAKREAHAHKVAAKLFHNTGMQPELFGEETGEASEDVGSSRSGRK